MNLIQLIDCWKANDEFSWSNFLFNCCKRILIWQKILVFLENLFEYYFLDIMWMLTSLVIWNLDITVSTTLKYCYKSALNKKIKLMWGTMKYFRKKLLGHEFIFHFWSKINKLGIPIRVLCALLKKNWLQEERLFRIREWKIHSSRCYYCDKSSSNYLILKFR